MKKQGSKNFQILRLQNVKAVEYNGIIKALEGKSGGENMRHTFDSIAGYELEKQELWSLCDIINNKEKYLQKGAKLPKGVIFYGDAGNGKTLFARVLANECNLKTIIIDLGSITRVSEISLLIKNAFSKAKESKEPTMIFFDELDKVLPNPDEEYYTDQSKTILTQLLTLIDGMDDSGNIIFVATCNYYGSLPETIVRPGRIDKKIGIVNPTYDSRVKIIKHYIDKTICTFSMSESEIARLCGGFSGAMLETLINECVLHSDEANNVSEELIRSKIREIKNEDIVRPESDANNYFYACTNIGSFIVARALNDSDYILKKDVSTTCNSHFDAIISNFDSDYEDEEYSDGYDDYDDYDDDDDDEDDEEDENEEVGCRFFTKSDYLDTITVLMGPYAMQELLFGQTYNNISFRIALAESIMLYMSRQGMLGLSLYYSPRRANDLDYNQKRCDALNALIDTSIQHCYERARKILQKNLKLANMLIPLLTKKETISKSECEEIIASQGGIRL